jgi:hypothetical protein
MLGVVAMSDEKVKFGPVGPEDEERRAALIKIGTYVAYTPPIVLATVSAARGQTISGATGPTGPQ